MTTSSNADVERVRITGPGDVAASVPHLLGFHPDDSLVVFCIKRPRLQIELTMRFDISSGPPTARLAAEAAIRAKAAGAHEVMLICYPTSAGPDLDVASRRDLPHADLVERTCAEMRERDVDVQNAVVVSRGRWRTYLCDDGCCASSEPVPAVSPHLAAVHAFRGHAVLSDRDAVVASLEPIGNVTRVSMLQAYRRQTDAMVERLGREGGTDALHREAVAAYDDAIARFADPRASLTDDETARLVLALEDVHVRDRVAALGLDHHDEAVALLTYLARRAYPPDDAPVCTTLAWVLCLDGGQLRARIALDRALHSDPTYSMALLLDQTIDAQIPPSAIRQLTRQAARTLTRRDRRRG